MIFALLAVFSTLTAPPSLLGAVFLVKIQCSITPLVPVKSIAPPSSLTALFPMKIDLEILPLAPDKNIAPPPAGAPPVEVPEAVLLMKVELTTKVFAVAESIAPPVVVAELRMKVEL